MDKDEDPLTAAKRELLEETGYVADEYIFWSATQLLRQTEWALYTFIAKGCKKGGKQKLDPGEKIKMKLIAPLTVKKATSRRERSFALTKEC